MQFLTEEYERGLSFNCLYGHIYIYTYELKNFLPNNIMLILRKNLRVYLKPGPQRLNIMSYGMQIFL